MHSGAERSVFWALALLTLARLLIGGFSEISSDESYYYYWAERLDWSYYSKGPGVAVAIHLVTSLFGTSEFAIRGLAAFLGLAMSVIFWRLGTELFDSRTALWALVILNLTPILNAGGIILTIDPLMMLFWVLAMLAVWFAVQRESTLWWAVAGLALGLGFLCKYTILIQLVGVVLFLALWPAHRRHFLRPGLYVMMAVLLVSMTPVLLWNSQNDWITIRHLIERTGLLDPTSSPSPEPEALPGLQLRPLDFLAYFGMHMGVYSPLIFLGLAGAVVASLRRWRASEEELFLAVFSLPVVLGYFLLSLFKMGELNWTAPGFVGLSLILVHRWPHWKLPRIFSKPAIVGSAFILASILTLWACNPDTLRSVGLSWPYANDPQWRLRGWRTLTEQLDREIRQFASAESGDIFLIANRYQMATPPAFYLPSESPLIQPSPRYPLIHMREPPLRLAKTQFSFWPSYYAPHPGVTPHPFAGKSALYFTDDVTRESPPPEITASFREVRPHAWFTATRHGLPVRSWKIFACHDYQP